MNPDIFICGTCKHQFNDVGMYMSHKEVCNMTNGQTCNFVTNQAHINHNQHCSVSTSLGSISDPALSAPVHHDHAYFHYEAPALVTSDVSGPAAQQASSSGLLMDMLSSLDGSQMAQSFTEQVVEEFIPPPPPAQPACSEPDQPAISMTEQAGPHHLQQHDDHVHQIQQHQQQQQQTMVPHMQGIHPQLHQQESNHQQPPQQHLQQQHHLQSTQHHLQQPQVSQAQQLQPHPHLQAQSHLQPQQHTPQPPQHHIQQPQHHQLQQQPSHHLQQSPLSQHLHQQSQHLHQQTQHQTQHHLHQQIQPQTSHLHQQVQHVQQQTQHLHQQTQHVQQQTHHLHQQTQHVQQQAPHLQQQTPHLQQQAPHIQQQAPHIQQQTSHLQQQNPHLQQQTQHLQQQSTHLQQQPTHIQQQPTQHVSQQTQPPPQHQTQHHMQQQPQQLSQHHLQQLQSQQQPPQTVASVYNAHMGVPVSAPSPAITGGYLAAVQRSEPLLVVSNGVLTYVSSGMLESGPLYNAPQDVVSAPTELQTTAPPPTEPAASDGVREAKELGDGAGPQEASGSTQLLSRMATPRLQCPFCRRRFRRNFDLQMHVRTHTGEKPFQCIVCGRAFAQRCNVRRHMESHKVWPTAGPGGGTLPDIHTFEVRLAENRQLIVRPTKSIDHVMERREYRVLYGRGGRSGANTEAAAGTGTGAGTGASGRSTEETLVLVDNCWECRFCRSRFEDFQKLRSHMRQHSDQQVYLCVLSDCRQTFKQLDAFLEHLEAHQQKKEMVYVCHVCHKTFLTVQQLGEHYNDHCKDPSRQGRAGPAQPDGDKVTYKCPECGHIFRRPAALQAHLVTTHGRGQEQAFSCSHCDKAFASEAALRHHIPLHATLAQFQCSRCPKAFKTRQYLRIHERTEHEHNSPFSCSRCGRGFLSRPALRNHILSAHEPHRKLKCPLAAATGCSFETAHATSIASHLATHSSVLRRPYPCAHCGWRFANALLLRRHLKKHRSALKKGAGGPASELQCEVCARLFLRRAPFENHVILCRQRAAERERRQERKRAQAAPQPPPPPQPPPQPSLLKEEAVVVKAEEADTSGADASTASGRPQRKRKFTAFWQPKKRRRRRTPAATAAQEEEEEASDGYEEVYDPMRMGSMISCEPASGGGGPSLPGIATFNQAITADHLDIAALVARPPNQNAPYTCSEDLKLLQVGEQFEEGRGAPVRPASREQGVAF